MFSYCVNCVRVQYISLIIVVYVYPGGTGSHSPSRPPASVVRETDEESLVEEEVPLRLAEVVRVATCPADMHHESAKAFTSRSGLSRSLTTSPVRWLRIHGTLTSCEADGVTAQAPDV